MSSNIDTKSSSTESVTVALLSTKTCGELIKKSLADRTQVAGANAPPERPVCLDSNLSVQEGCAALAAYRISSAPVYDHKQGGFVGMLDYRDLVAFVLEVLHKVPKQGGFEPDSEWEITDIVKRAVNDRQGVQIKYVSNLSQRNQLVGVNADAPILSAVKEMVANRVHRVVLLQPPSPDSDSAGGSRFIGILSQSSIASYLVSHLGKLASPKYPHTWDLGTKTLEELNFVKGNVVSITMQDTVLEALFLMHQNEISSVAIVDRADGYDRLCGNISMTDIKEVLGSRGGWRRLYDNAFRFFAQIRAAQGLENAGNDRAPSFVVHPTTTLINAMEKMTATRTHRAWIVDHVNRLVGVFSLSDLMPLLLSDKK
ncbi:cell separation during budding [Nowakowskiella sp. JEL0407]|nr:cell separation during budding [Nowakowskiella sp. JEL0407]